jgi:hypothetical protein
VNLAIVRHIVLNMLKRDTSILSLKRKRLKASIGCLLVNDLGFCLGPTAARS